ncbi:tripartite tricarboxylate transporter substrate binding protein [Aeromicrobium camelliae]|uniref:Tripartite tricarboxylate transporter substrate binding protein n=2 Tax=Aeromicrobium camelliae TaxID=1538144 RepID=A0A3N6WJM0_9ACTN|nr:tripartite tricarboxylate transporter substrate binding protein [Aeromicrobium camelliae]
MLVLALVTVLVASGCGVTRDGGDDPTNRRLRMMIPNSPGGGYDLTGRSATRAMEENDLTGRFEITNVIGAGGTVAMQRLLNEEGADDLMMTMGLGVVGSTYTNGAAATVSEATPIAQLVEEYEGILVPGDSPYRTVGDLVEAWKADPGGVTIGGGSSPGGPDHLFPMQLAQTVGIAPRDVNYITYDGGGPLTTALLGGKIDAGMSGLGEFEGQIADGSLRVLAVSGPERLDTVDAPTLTESGIDMTFTNWRGVLAPPGISEETREDFIDLLARMRETPEWEDALERNGWTDAFLPGDEFGEFLVEQDTRVATTLKELGLV